MGKSRKGGYKLVSLQLIELTTMNACAGLYGAIVNSHDKPLMLDDIKVDGEKKNALYVKAIKGTNKYTIKGVYGYILEVNADDEVTITQDAEGIELPIPQIADAGKVVGVDANGEYDLVEPRSDAQVKALAKAEVEGAESGTIVDALGLNADGKLVKGTISGGGTKLYKHYVRYGIGSASFNIISTISTAFTTAQNVIDGFNTLKYGWDMHTNIGAKMYNIDTSEVGFIAVTGNGVEYVIESILNKTPSDTVTEL